MKKRLLKTLIIFSITACFLFNNTVTYASATHYQYLRVVDDNTPFFADENGSKLLFYLPYSYYVKVLDFGDELSHVEYSVNGIAIDGYTITSKLINENNTPLNPYLTKVITTCDTAVLYRSVTDNDVICYVFPDRELYLYGKLVISNENYYYVLYNNKLGYVKETEIYPFIVTPHPNELNTIPPNEQNPDGNGAEQLPVSPNTSEVTLRFIIIGLLLIAGVIAVFISLYPKRKKDSCKDYYNESDGE